LVGTLGPESLDGSTASPRFLLGSSAPEACSLSEALALLLTCCFLNACSTSAEPLTLALRP
jgi:hypothetical protein